MFFDEYLRTLLKKELKDANLLTPVFSLKSDKSLRIFSKLMKINSLTTFNALELFYIKKWEGDG